MAVDFTMVGDRLSRGAVNGYDQVIAGDFDGDRREDLFFYESSTGSNRIAFARGNEQFSIVTERLAPGKVNGYDTVVAGDFDGDGRDDLFFLHLALGSNRIAFARGNEQFTIVDDRLGRGAVNGYQQVVAGDFDGDRRDDLFFIHMQSGAHRIAFARGNEQFTVVDDRIGRGAVNGYSQVVAGNFNGDRYDDLFFVQFANGANRIAYGRGNEQFGVVRDTIARDYVFGSSQVVAGDFDGNSSEDLLFRHKATGANVFAFHSTNFANSLHPEYIWASEIKGLNALASGDFDGDRRADLYFSAIGSGENRLGFARERQPWDWSGGHASEPTASAASGSSRTIVEAAKSKNMPLWETIGGNVAKIRVDLPNTNQDPLGSGVRVAENGGRFVLTAKHVIQKAPNWQSIEVTFPNAVRYLGVAQSFRVVRVTLHPTLDLAVLELAERPQVPFVGVFAEASNLAIPNAGSELLIAGYGRTGTALSGGVGPSGSLNYGFAQLNDRKTLDLTIDGMGTIRGEYLVNRFDSQESAIARGDAGGPNIVVRKLVMNGRVHYYLHLAGISTAAAGNSVGGSMWYSTSTLSSDVQKWLRTNVGSFKQDVGTPAWANNLG